MLQDNLDPKGVSSTTSSEAITRLAAPMPVPRVRVTGQVRAERSTGADAVEVVRRCKDAVVQRDFDDLEHCVALNAAKALTKGRFSGVISGISP